MTAAGDTPVPTRQLLIMRHAKSDWGTAAVSDFDRPLAPRGRRDAPRVGRWLARNALVPDHVLASPALRARETVLAVLEQLPGSVPQPHWDERLYPGALRQLLDALADVPGQAHTVLLVAHNPGLEELLCHLAGSAGAGGAPGAKLLPTAALARLALASEWGALHAGSAARVTVTRPREIDD